MWSWPRPPLRHDGSKWGAAQGRGPTVQREPASLACGDQDGMGIWIAWDPFQDRDLLANLPVAVSNATGAMMVTRRNRI